MKPNHISCCFAQNVPKAFTITFMSSAYANSIRIAEAVPRLRFLVPTLSLCRLIASFHMLPSALLQTEAYFLDLQ